MSNDRDWDAVKTMGHIGANVESILRHLDNAQWWPTDVMRRHQFTLLRPLVAHAYRTVPWYRQQFDSRRIAVDQAVEGASWRSLPLLTRFDIQAAGAALHSTEVSPNHGQVRSRWTSGSTASPVMVLMTEVTARNWVANTLRELDWQSCNLARKLAVIRNAPRGSADPPEGATRPTWGNATANRIKTGPCAALDIRSTTAEQADWLVREQPTYLQTYPSIVFELAVNFITTRRRLPSLEKVWTFGEVLEPTTRDACRRAWGVEILDSYSANEVGYVATQCPGRDLYHVHAEHLLVEVVDDDGQACAPGETGRVVVTDLFNYAMPLLRYEIGDYAEVGEECPCGRKLPTLRRILGRQRNMFVLPNGERRWPAMDVDALGAFEGPLPVRQFQAVQHSRSDIEVKLVVVRPLKPEEESRVRALLATWFCEGLQVRFTYVDRIPRGPSGKFEDFRCEIPQDT